MSIQSEINRIKNNVDLSLEAVASKGVSVPADANSDNLPQLIEAISAAPDPTTVWLINETPNTEALPSLLGARYVISFTSNNTSYVGFFGQWIGMNGAATKAAIRYATSDTAYITVWTNSAGWTDEAYRTVTFNEEIVDEGLLDWLNENATLISGGGDDDRYDEGYSDGVDSVKVGEARTGANVTEWVDIDSCTVDVDIESGYYATGISRTVDVQDVYDAGYNDGLADGGGGDSNPTTVWEINETPNLEGLSDTPVQTSFTSNGTSCGGIWIAGPAPGVKCLYYGMDAGVATPVYTLTSSASSWTDEAYRTITVHEEIVDEGLLDWLNENATLISGGDRYDEGYSDGYDEGYNDGLADGGGDSDPTTVWKFYWSLQWETVPTINVNFISAGVEYTGFEGSTNSALGGNALVYRTADGQKEVIWSVYMGWYNQACMLITIPDAITDETLLQFLQENAELISGSGSEINDMMLWDGYGDWGGDEKFYSYKKWLWYDISSLSSAPVVISLENNNPLKYLHVYVYIDEMNVGERWETIVVPPATADSGWYSYNSLEIDNPCYSAEIYGIRWSDDGV